jgi:hypothetical protein
VERGSFYCSVRELAKYWSWSTFKIHAFLEKLKKNKMILVKNITGKNQIYVINYDTYQVPDYSNNTGTTHNQHRSNTNRKKINKTNKTNTNVVPELRILSKCL